MEMVEERPATRCAARPGRRLMESAMDTSGSLPMSSAEIASTMLVDSRLASIARSMPARTPVTVMRSRSVAVSSVCAAASASTWAWVASWAWACAASIAVADSSATLNRLRRNFT